MNIVEPSNQPVHIGIDVAKATLQIDLLGKSRKLPNTTPGHRAILGMLPENAFIIMESTGSYHIAAQESFQAAGIPVSIVNPVRVKQFGKARGTLAKTDPVDASLLSDFGRAFLPRPTPPRDPERVLLCELVNLRDTLIAQVTMWNNLVEHQPNCGTFLLEMPFFHFSRAEILDFARVGSSSNVWPTKGLKMLESLDLPKKSLTKCRSWANQVCHRLVKGEMRHCACFRNRLLYTAWVLR